MHSHEKRCHNDGQRAYFEADVKPTMVPRDTPYVRRHVREVLDFAGVTPRHRVLEVGCGMGRYTLPLARHGMRLEGLDLSPVLLERLEAYNGGEFEIPLHCADLLEPPAYLEGQFDTVIGFFTLHHLPDLAAGFAGMRRLVKPGGRIVFLEPNAYNPLFYLQVLLTPGMTWSGDRGIFDMRPGLLSSAAAQAGLERTALRRFGFFPPFLANVPWGRRLESLLETLFGWTPFLPFQVFRAERPLHRT